MSLTYVITGASRGLGLEFVKQLAAKGHTIFACARNPATADRLEKYVDNKHVFVVKLDTTDYESIKAAAEQISKMAPQGIDVLINNAGIASEKSDRVPENILESDLLYILQTNVVGTSNVTKEFLPLLQKRGADHVKKIVNISSLLGSIELINQASPSGVRPSYNISKAALNMYTKMLSNNLAKDNFIVYSSHPGWVKTEAGGEEAPVEVEESISGQLSVLDHVTAKDNGAFLDWEGNAVPW
ncbi:C-factor-like [Mucor ambiguus]|uniref:C-factor-like n=1 Tax=Mucor ambiguus TaxID=91626 RepID=A0A0C9MQS3_9FUNG|nr:C-factor-like [Mucor ambiguus]